MANFYVIFSENLLFLFITWRPTRWWQEWPIGQLLFVASHYCRKLLQQLFFFFVHATSVYTVYMQTWHRMWMTVNMNNWMLNGTPYNNGMLFLLLLLLLTISIIIVIITQVSQVLIVCSLQISQIFTCSLPCNHLKILSKSLTHNSNNLGQFRDNTVHIKYEQNDI